MTEASNQSQETQGSTAPPATSRGHALSQAADRSLLGCTPNEMKDRGERTAVHVACCADNAYVMGLAVTLTSAAQSLDSQHRLIVDLVDGGISIENRERLIDTCTAQGIELCWRELNDPRLDQLPVSHHISRTAYFRVLLGELLSDRKRVLYLDSDLLIRDDLLELWQTELGESWCAAAADVGCPYFDAYRVLRNIRRAGPYLSVFRPIRNYRQLGFSGQEPYFNSGLLLIDLEAWREEKIAERTLACLEANRRFVWCWDQYGLNVILAHHWKRWPVRWNVGAHLYEYPNDQSLPLPVDECMEALANPAVIHFTTNRKPWTAGATHPHTAEFFEVLDQTRWQGLRPTPSPATLKNWVVDRTTELRRAATISGRHALLASLPPRENVLTQRRSS